MTQPATTQLSLLIRDFEITVWTDKKRYALGEEVKALWRFKNVSPQSRSLYVAGDALSLNLSPISNNDRAGSRDIAAPQSPPFVEVKAGEEWTRQYTFEGRFRAGLWGLKWRYDSRGALEGRVVVPPNTVFLSRQGGQEMAIEILPASKAQLQRLEAGLRSPRWNEQLEAARQMLLWDDARGRGMVQALAPHPYEDVRVLAAEAMARGGAFSPALKALMYGGTSIQDHLFARAERDYALALLAVRALEEEALERGATDARDAVYRNVSFYNRLGSGGDARVGDLLAARLRRGGPLEGGVNNGVILYSLCGLREGLMDSGAPLPDDLQAQVLAAWDAKRAGIKGLFTSAQLEAEIALARHIRYDNFRRGPFYQSIVALLDEGSTRNFKAGPEQDAWDSKLLALPAGAAPDMLRVLKWRRISSPPRSVLRFLARSGQRGVFDLLAQIAYGQGWANGDSRVEAIRLMAQLDFKRARVHLENFLAQPHAPLDRGSWSPQAPRLGAAIALSARGDKRGVPIIFLPEYEKRLIALGSEAVGAALRAATARDFASLAEWRRWWQREGQKMRWK